MIGVNDWWKQSHAAAGNQEKALSFLMMRSKQVTIHNQAGGLTGEDSDRNVRFSAEEKFLNVLL